MEMRVELEIPVLCLISRCLHIALYMRLSEKIYQNVHSMIELSFVLYSLKKKKKKLVLTIQLISKKAQEQKTDYLDRLVVFMSAGFEEVYPWVN